MSSHVRTFEPIKVVDADKFADPVCLLCGTLEQHGGELHICHRCAGNLLARRYQGVAHLLDYGMVNLDRFNEIDYGDLHASKFRKDDEPARQRLPERR